MRTMKKFVVLTLVLFLSGSAFGQISWEGDESSRWDADGNWSTGVAPTAGDAVVMDITATGTTILIDAATTALANGVQVGSSADGLDPTFTLNMTGGTLTNGGGTELDLGRHSDAIFNLSGGVVNSHVITLGNRPGGSGVMTMDGGEVNLGFGLFLTNHLDSYGELTMNGGKITYAGPDPGDQGAAGILAANGADSLITMNGGEIDLGLGNLWVPWNSPGSSEIQLNGGIIRTNRLDMDGRDACGDCTPGLLNITGGTLIVGGEWNAQSPEVVAGYITADGGTGTLEFNFNGSQTVITAGGILLGDFNDDLTVDTLDADILRTHLNAHLDGSVAYEDGDIDFDGDVDLGDFAQLKNILQNPPATAQATGVPEPSSVVLSLSALAGIAALARRRSQRAQ
ncbi:PEP-CTERM sorting domain-containing protein [Pirellulales bacterium]|nr:PEP-CTERM sorting domain-containing protein [Pirellulales bacterium]